MAIRDQILDAAARLLAESENVDISTRAVCVAANVSAPSLYHHFGDKNGLLVAVVDLGWTQFLSSKHEATKDLPPSLATEIRASWENHLQFARENPNVYKLMWSPVVSRTSAAVAQSHQMAQRVMERGAQRGELRVPVDVATRMAMATVTGAAMSLVSHPDLFTDTTFADQMRETLIAQLMADLPPAHTEDERAPSLSAAAVTLLHLVDTEPIALSAAEGALLREWLTRIGEGTGRASSPSRR